jgi:hypothetical protein
VYWYVRCLYLFQSFLEDEPRHEFTTLPQVWDLFENRHLFKAEDSNGQDSNLHHLAEMVALLGPPPRDFLQHSNYASEFFDNDG